MAHPTPTRIGGAVLAAGAGSRMGRPKAEVEIAGERLVDRALRVLLDAGCEPVWAVVRAGVTVRGAHRVVNPDPARGMRSSLELAIIESGRSGVDALAVVLVDVPGLTASAVRAVTTAWRPGRIAVGVFGRTRGHPTVMSTDDWRAALKVAGPDEGARRYLATERGRVEEIEVDGDPTDLDTPEELTRWLASGRAELPDP